MTTQDEPTGFDLLPPLDDRPGPARRVPAKRAQLIIDGALAAAARPAPRRLQLLAAAAALVCLVGVASAAYLLRRPRPAPAAPVTAPEPVSTPARGGAPSPSPGPLAVAAPSAVPKPSLAPAPAAALAPQAEPPATATPTAGPALAPRRAPAPRQGAPEDLLQQANERRRERRWLEADALYQRVLRAHPGGAAAYFAGVASAALHLEQLGDARGALRLYQGALRTRPGGTLDDEARRGVAEACRALGDGPCERRALGDLLRLHPDSPLRRGAEARLRELDATPR